MQATAPCPSFEHLDDSLLRANSDTTAAEAHGMLCGMICASGEANTETWLQHLLGEDEPHNLLRQETRAQLEQLQQSTQQQISDGNYALRLLLPDDDNPLEERVDALSDWCHGFLFGMSLAGIEDVDNLPSDAREILQDILQIAKASYDEEADEEEHEAAYMEVVEYLRVGTLIIYAELNPPLNEQGEKTLH